MTALPRRALRSLGAACRAAAPAAVFVLPLVLVHGGAGGLESPARLHVVHCSALAAALLAFVLRPSALRRPITLELTALWLWAAVLAWSVASVAWAEAPGAAYRRTILTFDAGLLFFVGWTLTHRRPVLSIAFVVLAFLGMLAADAFDAARPAASLAAAGAVGLSATLAALTFARRGAFAERLACATPVIAAALWIALRWGAGFTAPGAPDDPLDAARREAVLRDAAEVFAERPVRGLGPGAVERRLAARGLRLAPWLDDGAGRHALLTPAEDLFPPGLIRPQREPAAPPPAPASARQVASGAPSAPIVAFLEQGVVGFALQAALVVFVAAAAFGRLRQRRPRPGRATATWGLLATLLLVGLECAAAPIGLHPLALFSFAALGGLLWGGAGMLLEPRGAAPVSAAEDRAQREAARRWEGLVLGHSAVREARAWFGRPLPEWAHWAPSGAGGWALFLAALAVVALCVRLTGRPLEGERMAAALRGRIGAVDAAKWERAASLAPLSSRIRLEEGLNLLGLRRMEREAGRTLAPRAGKALREAVELDPFDEAAHVGLAAYYLATDNAERMLEAAVRGRALCPNSVALALWEARAAMLLGDSSRLERAWIDAVLLASAEGRPPDLQTRLLDRLAEYHERRGFYRLALEDRRRLLQCRPTVENERALHRLNARAALYLP